MHSVSTTDNTQINQFKPQSKNLASIVRRFKIGITQNARKINSDLFPRSHAPRGNAYLCNVLLQKKKTDAQYNLRHLFSRKKYGKVRVSTIVR